MVPADTAVFGPLAYFVDDPQVSDIFLNPDGRVWIDKGEGAQVESMRVPRGEAYELAVRLIAAGGRHLDEATPCADVRLGEGIRVHGVLPPISPGSPSLSIRVQRAESYSLDDLEENAFFALVPRAGVEELVMRRANLLVTGAGGTGKTTLLTALLQAASPSERIILVEDVGELRPEHPHTIRLEARQANMEGAGEVTLERLVREALRMRPDRLVVGECRGAELRELLSALNTGHDGGAGTLHANSLNDVPARLEALGALVGWSPETVARQAVSALDAVLHLERDANGHRYLAARGVLRIDGSGRMEAVPG